jgi:signal transduction histidine kinase
METGNERYRREAIDVGPVIRQVVAELTERAPDDAARIDLDGPSHAAIAMADADALAVAVRNLVDNALKYAPGSRVAIEWAASDGRIRIAVRDHGPGIDDAEQAAVFQKFVRGREALAGGVKGTGVGLAMVRHIAAAHGGDIGLESTIGRGSTFTISIPAAAETIADTAGNVLMTSKL